MCLDPNPPSDTDPILDKVELFLRASGMSAAAFGVAAMGDPALVYEMRKGRDLRRSTRARIGAFIRAAMETI